MKIRELQKRMKIRELQKRIETITSYKNSKPIPVCPVCGLNLNSFPHSEQECMEWFMADYRDADETRADLLQF